MQTSADLSSQGKDSPIPASDVPTEQPGSEADGIKRGYVLGVVCTSHLLIHLQVGVSSVLLPVMMKELGFGFFQLGLLSSLNQLAGSGMQVVYGLLTQYYRRSALLGVANIVMGLFAASTGLAQTFTHVLVCRVGFGLGSSAQHPLGSTLLSSFFRRAKGQVLGINQTAANVGALAGPLIVVAMLSFLDWRAIWVILAIPSVLLGIALFFFRDAVSRPGASKKGRTKVALSSYIACLRNREVMVVSAVQLVGAAGRGTGVNQTFLVPFFQTWMGADLVAAAMLLALLQLGGVVGPIGIGWLSDRTSRKLVIFAVLFLSSVSTITLLLHSQVSVALVVNLLLYGAVVTSRESLTQTMVSDAVPEEHADAAFSLYYFIGFISGPAWTALTGYLVAAYGFGPAFVVAGATYLNGIWLLGLLSPKKKSSARTAV